MALWLTLHCENFKYNFGFSQHKTHEQLSAVSFQQ